MQTRFQQAAVIIWKLQVQTIKEAGKSKLYIIFRLQCIFDLLLEHNFLHIYPKLRYCSLLQLYLFDGKYKNTPFITSQARILVGRSHIRQENIDEQRKSPPLCLCLNISFFHASNHILQSYLISAICGVFNDVTDIFLMSGTIKQLCGNHFTIGKL